MVATASLSAGSSGSAPQKSGRVATTTWSNESGNEEGLAALHVRNAASARSANDGEEVGAAGAARWPASEPPRVCLVNCSKKAERNTADSDGAFPPTSPLSA